MKWERTLVVCEKVNCYLVQYYIKLIKKKNSQWNGCTNNFDNAKKGWEKFVAHFTIFLLMQAKCTRRMTMWSLWVTQKKLKSRQKTYKISKSLLNHRLEFIRTIDKDLIIDSKTDVGSSFFLLFTLSVFFPDARPRLPPLPDFIRKGLDEFSIFYIKNGNSKSHSLLSSRGVFDRSQSRLLSITFS